MEKIMISIKPEQLKNILSKNETILIRKTIPKCELPCKVYICCTNSSEYAFYNDRNKFMLYKINKEQVKENMCYGTKLNGKVVAEFTLDKINKIERDSNDCIPKDKKVTEQCLEESCLTKDELLEYENNEMLYSWCINNLVIYDTPKELNQFSTTPHCFQTKNVEFKTNVFNEYIGQYYKNSFCHICKYYNSDWNDCMKGYKKLEKPPSNWCYCEEI